MCYTPNHRKIITPKTKLFIKAPNEVNFGFIIVKKCGETVEIIKLVQINNF